MVLGIVRLLGLLFCVQVVEVAVGFVEAVHRRQVVVAVAEVVLADLSRHVAQRLEQLGDRRILCLEALLSARQAHGSQAGAHGQLARDERGAPGSATCLRIGVEQHRAVAGDAVDIRRLRPHGPAVVGADVEPAQVVGEDGQNVGRLLCIGCHGGLL